MTSWSRFGVFYISGLTRLELSDDVSPSPPTLIKKGCSISEVKKRNFLHISSSRNRVVDILFCKHFILQKYFNINAIKWRTI